MWGDERLKTLLGIDIPIIQAPMAGASTPQMAAEASNAGALGSLACALISAADAEAEYREARLLTDGPLSMNFFCHTPPQVDAKRAQAALARLAPWFERLGVDEIPAVAASSAPFGPEVCAMLCDLKPQAASFHFGLPDAALVSQIKAQGIKILSSATSVAEAKWLEGNGADLVIAQGAEAGGHSGWFLPRGGAEMTGVMALTPRIVDAIRAPVVAAGGIADGRGVAAALTLGAAGAQIGTAFLRTPESKANAAYRAALAGASGDDTMFSSAFSGRPARTIVNAYADDMRAVTDWPDFPMMNTVTGPLRKASAARGAADAVSLWAGQAVGLSVETTTQDLLRTLVEQTTTALKRGR